MFSVLFGLSIALAVIGAYSVTVALLHYGIVWRTRHLLGSVPMEDLSKALEKEGLEKVKEQENEWRLTRNMTISAIFSLVALICFSLSGLMMAWVAFLG